MKQILIPVETSVRHVHLSEADWQTLFATPHPTVSQLISQRPQFLAMERVALIGPKSTLEQIGVVGPLREHTQVEIAQTDARVLGVTAPLRASGKADGAATVTIRGPKGQITTPVAMIAQRHIHASPQAADDAGLRDGDDVSIRVDGPRGGQLDHVMVRVHPTFAWHLHLDTDEANAVGVVTGTEARVIIHL